MQLLTITECFLRVISIHKRNKKCFVWQLRFRYKCHRCQKQTSSTAKYNASELGCEAVLSHDKLQKHLKECKYEQSRWIIEPLKTENLRLADRVDYLESKFDDLSENYEKLQEIVKELQQQMKPKYDIEKEAKVVIVGLESSGKTTIIYQYKIGEMVTTIPTEDFNMDIVQHKNVEYTMWDIGGADKESWPNHYLMANVIIFVVDSNDHNRMPEARTELHKMLADELLEESIVLIIANKQDLPNAMSVSEITDTLDLSEIKQKWHIEASSAVSNETLQDGLEWITENLNL